VSRVRERQEKQQPASKTGFGGSSELQMISPVVFFLEPWNPWPLKPLSSIFMVRGWHPRAMGDYVENDVSVSVIRFGYLIPPNLPLQKGGVKSPPFLN
jgi:hypothetical protein